MGNPSMPFTRPVVMFWELASKAVRQPITISVNNLLMRLEGQFCNWEVVLKDVNFQDLGMNRVVAKKNESIFVLKG
jgi:hypothetical protein